MEKIREIIDVVFSNGFINGHNDKHEEVDAVCIYTKGSDVYVCPAYRNTYYSLNPVWLQGDGTAYLSTASVGPTLKGLDRGEMVTYSFIGGVQTFTFLTKEEWEPEYQRELEYRRNHDA